MATGKFQQPAHAIALSRREPKGGSMLTEIVQPVSFPVQMKSVSVFV